MSTDRTAIADSVAAACTESAGTVQALAEEVGVSYAALCSWSRGRRTPPPHRLMKLADVLEDRAERLWVLAAELRVRAETRQAPTRAEAADARRPAAEAPAEPRDGMERPSSGSWAPLAARSRGEPRSGWPVRRERPDSIPMPVSPPR
jgi:transcriptional regulator with XRE-family HTH domain